MAILSKIRERSMFLILVVGLALFAFVLDPSTISDFFNSTKVNDIGSVNGETISRQEFSDALEAYKQNSGGRVSEMQAAKNVWNSLLRQKIYEAQLENAGITVGEADIMNALIESSGVQNQERFQTEGIFDRSKFTEFLATIKEANGDEWRAWQGYMGSLKSNLEKTTYDNLVTSGLGASLKEGENKYLTENTKISGKYVYAPYTLIADSLVTVTKGDVKKYIESHASDYEVEASRDVKFVKFDIKPTSEDEAVIEKNVASFIEDSEKNGIKAIGLKNTTDYSEFFDENDSDVAYDDKFQFKVQVPQVIADKLFEGKQGDVFGPYKDGNFFKLSKITEVTQLPDSAQARHILVPFVGASSADPSITRTEEEAKVLADSLMAAVKQSPSKFADLAKDFSSDKGSASKGGFYDWFGYNRMVTEFRDFVFKGKKNDIGVVKTVFGFHVIRTEDQKNFQPVLKLATFGKEIVASEATENTIYQGAELFSQDLANGKSYDEVLKEKSLKSLPAVGLKALDENVPGLGNERDIITWAFEKDVKVGDYKRFDIEGGYAVAVLTNKTSKGLMSVDKATASIRPILVKEKKAKMLEDKMTGSTLEDIAKNAGQTVRNANKVNLQSPTLAGVGYEPKIIGAMLSAKENTMFNNVVGDRGVFAFSVESKELPTALPNYDTYRKRLANDRKNKSFQIFEAIKKASEIEDNVGNFYGIQQ
ncbi:peptidyl-prolyl cis-trans isomerase D [Tenacibaculum sp. MAR_2009_124]|uniref:peptidylprolyl isomerase n=1 Tax=Tenacibaculum sp. MAR_2009_124 TaxID=1250059 RepID=UPI00089CF156|nr:peptidylprolyl isomerase [Tenacibaculum sp. MAR_2009_124]SEC80628.1 peptidyl-prolyl cis-trans isomerase D [Tenacibaculum sp. MAR_2009_124]